MTDLSPEVVERMVALVRRIADGFRTHGINETGMHDYEAVIVAQQIVRGLPEPVDQDEEEAKRIAFIFGSSGRSAELPILAAIKRGRELALAQASGGVK